jgi:hypothetical protein
MSVSSCPQQLQINRDRNYHMHKLTVRVAIALLMFLIGVGATAAWLINRSPKQEPQVMLPDARWVPILFESTGLASKSINERTKEANLASLRTVLLPDDDLEVRVWAGFGVVGVDGFILRRYSNQWSAIYLHGMAERPPFPNSTTALGAPKSGWEPTWQSLMGAGIVTLPDASALGCDTYLKDGTGYVVELNMNKTYRTYNYPDPNYAKCDEAKQMVKIIEIIADEFGLQNFGIVE